MNFHQLKIFYTVAQQQSVTQAGEAFYRSTVTILHAKDEAERAIAEIGAATKRKLILGTNTTGGMYLLPRIVRAFKESHPGTEIRFQIESTEWLYGSLSFGRKQKRAAVAVRRKLTACANVHAAHGHHRRAYRSFYLARWCAT